MGIFKAFPARTEQRTLEQRDILGKRFERRLLSLNRGLLLSDRGLLLFDERLLLGDRGLLLSDRGLLLGMDLGHRLHPGMALGQRLGQRGIKHRSGSPSRETPRQTTRRIMPTCAPSRQSEHLRKSEIFRKINSLADSVCASWLTSNRCHAKSTTTA
jgi:hypothetical protein